MFRFQKRLLRLQLEDVALSRAWLIAQHRGRVIGAKLSDKGRSNLSRLCFTPSRAGREENGLDEIREGCTPTSSIDDDLVVVLRIGDAHTNCEYPSATTQRAARSVRC